MSDLPKPRIPLSQIPLLALPRYFAGLRFGQWIRLLNRHRWDVDLAFLPRVLAATAGTLLTSALAPVDRLLRRDTIDTEAWEQPLFVLGLPRSGTTHLFNLMARDPRFCHGTRFDVFHAHTFLTRRALGLHHLYRLVPSRQRDMDAVRVHWLSPEEDRIATSLLMGEGMQLEYGFPRHPNAPAPSGPRYIAALREFTRKLVQVHGRPVVLKSPENTGHIPDLLAAFPRARFVMIFREPRAHAASLLGIAQSANRYWAVLQWPGPVALARTLFPARRDLERYFAERSMIPEGQLVEIRHEDLVADEAGTIRGVYAGLGLTPPGWLDVPVRGAHRPYRKNAHPPLPNEVEAGIPEAFHLLYERVIYPRPTGEGQGIRSAR